MVLRQGLYLLFSRVQFSLQNPETTPRLGDEEVGRCKAPGEVKTAATSRL